MFCQGSREINQTFYRLRLLLPIALTTGMRIAEVFALKWSDLRYREGVIAVTQSSRAARAGTCL